MFSFAFTPGWQSIKKASDHDEVLCSTNTVTSVGVYFMAEQLIWIAADYIGFPHNVDAEGLQWFLWFPNLMYVTTQ